ncbi:hypothetical protein Dimus_034540 [Dionaea muscipula]
MVDVVSSNGWLSVALLIMEVSQMVTQGMWERDSMLLQLPHFTKELVKKCQEKPGKSIDTVFDLAEMADDERQELLQMSGSQLLDVVRSYYRYPNIDLTYDMLSSSDNIRAGEDILLDVVLDSSENLREDQKWGLLMLQGIQRPKKKAGGWWLVAGGW